MAGNLEIMAWCKVAFNAGVPSITQQDGSFTTTVGDTAAGDITLNLKTEYGLDSTKTGWSIQVDGALAASQLTSFGLVHTSDTAKQITILREGAMGAVSALTDVAFTIFFIRLNTI
jgi:hypothetical protein